MIGPVIADISQVWQSLAAAVGDRADPLRTPVVATADADGADARIMVLRAVDPARSALTFHTDRRSAKVAALALPVAVAAWSPVRQVQLRLRGTATLGDAATTRAAASSIPPAARLVYRSVAPPGTPAASLAAAAAHSDDDGSDNFALFVVTVASIETLDLSAAPHRRVRYVAADGWRGSWLTP